MATKETLTFPSSDGSVIEPIIISAAWSTSFLILFTISSTSKRVKSSPPVILIKRPLAPFNE